MTTFTLRLKTCLFLLGFDCSEHVCPTSACAPEVMTLRHFINRFFTIIKLLDYFVFPEQTEHTSITTHYHKNNGHTDLRQYCQISLQQTHKLRKKN